MSAESDFMVDCIMAFLNDDPAIGYYQKSIQGSYDPSTGDYSASIVEIPCSIILEDLTRNSNGLSYDFGTDIVAGDKNCYLLPPEKADPTAIPLVIDTVADRIRVGTQIYRIINMKSADPTGANPLLYQLMLRR